MKKDDRPFRVKERLSSFINAFRGLRLLIKNEHNFRIHLFILVLVIIAGILLRITCSEWIAIALSTGLVLAGESFNTAIEYLADKVSPDMDPQISKVKDIAAAGVLIAAALAVIVGVIIFLPKITGLFR